MKSIIITAVTAVVALSSCSVYRSGQTPDDVYFSPGKGKQAAYVETNDGKQPTYNGYNDYATADDRWLMMRVRNRSRCGHISMITIITIPTAALAMVVMADTVAWATDTSQESASDLDLAAFMTHTVRLTTGIAITILITRKLS